jgi:hypothetical protein
MFEPQRHRARREQNRELDDGIDTSLVGCPHATLRSSLATYHEPVGFRRLMVFHESSGSSMAQLRTNRDARLRKMVRRLEEKMAAYG